MLLIVEIILTVIAFNRYSQAKKSWGLGLIPIGVAMVLGMLLGLILGVSNADLSYSLCYFAVIDLGVIGYLIYIINTVKPEAQ